MILEDLDGRGGMRLRSLAMVEVMVVACGAAMSGYGEALEI